MGVDQKEGKKKKDIKRPSKRANGFFVATDIFDGALSTDSQKKRGVWTDKRKEKRLEDVGDEVDEG
jgi:hypothetical protein